MLTLNKKYIFFAIILFITEVFIAIFVRDNFVRPYLGDVLVVILLYCFLRSFLHVPVLALAISVLIFSFLIEFLQYLNIVEKLGLEHSELANTLIGNSFAWQDIIAYIAGFAIVLLVEKYREKKR